MNLSTERPIAPAVVEQASHWLMLQWDGGLSAEQRQALQRWQDADPEHRRAWARLQQLQGTLQVAPQQTVRQLLSRRGQTSRRELIKLLGLALMVGSSGYVAQQKLPWREALADQRTAPGERRQLQLPDQSLLSLNSDSAVNIRFDQQQRRIQLVSGELLLTSAKHSQRDPRPLLVETAAGEIQALGTRFAVRQRGAVSQLDLFQGELEVRPRDSAPLRLSAGSALAFSASGPLASGSADQRRVAWQQGKLIAEQQPIGDFLAELARHRPGVIQCDQDVAALPLSGVFPLADTDRVLSALADILPVRIHYYTRYWVRVTAV
ncbi:FecR domain-containing protein [Halopseudomonas pachastrellae]|uniref:FecR domain-containing protein n=1 Tax=Halopseudomonas pachastrellae TaxID=254161 RepID=UPI003D7E9DFF